MIGARTLAWWIQKLAGVDCCVGPVLTLQDALEHPQFRDRGMVVQDPVTGSPQFGFAVTMTGFQFAIPYPAPLPGRPADAVLQRLGVDAVQRGDLRDRGVIGCACAGGRCYRDRHHGLQ